MTPHSNQRPVSIKPSYNNNIANDDEIINNDDGDEDGVDKEKRFPVFESVINIPDSKVHGTNMGPIWGRQVPGGPHFGPMNFAIWDNKDPRVSKTKQRNPYL